MVSIIYSYLITMFTMIENEDRKKDNNNNDNNNNSG